MKILIAEDDMASRRVLEATLVKFEHEVVVAVDGAEAWAMLQSVDAPDLAILDWMMPGVDGVELCRRVRLLPTSTPPYLILLTAKSGKENVVTGLEAGANDYLTKPFDRDELRARVQVGAQVLELQRNLAERVTNLKLRSLRSNSFRVCCQSAPTVRRFVTNRTIGSGLTAILQTTPMCYSVMGYVQTATRMLHLS